MKKLTLEAVFLVGVLVAVAQQKYAFLVGINKYFDSPGVQNPHQLQGCVNDAYAMKAMLEYRFGFAPANMTVLSDEGATRQNVVNGLLAMAEKCNAGDAAVFFFSGHGVWMGNDYLLAVSDSIKQGMSQAMVMSDLYSEKMGCLLTDAVLKKLVNKFIDKKVVVTTFFDCCFSGNLPMLKGLFGHNIYNDDFPKPVEKSIGIADIFYLKGRHDSMVTPEFERNLNHALNDLPALENNAKAFDMSAAINITDSERIARPSERKGSMFLSLSATTDREKGQDIQTETGSYHGAFTYALLQAVASHPSSIPVDTIQADIVRIMAQQLYVQTPIFHYDPQRAKSNLIGIATDGFKNSVIVPCSRVKKNQVSFSQGTIAGIKQGNLLESEQGGSKAAVQITFANEDSAAGKLYAGNGSLIKAGQGFTVTDSYTESSPLIKIYIDGGNFTADAFYHFFNAQVMPLVEDGQYADFKNYNNVEYIQTILLKNLSPVPGKARLGLTGQNGSSYFVFLPIPNYITNPLKTVLAKNQNIQLVNAAEKADFALYLNYVKGSKEEKPGFVLTYQRPGDFAHGGLRLLPEAINISNLKLTPDNLVALTKTLKVMTRKMIRRVSQQWINDCPAR